MQAQGASRSSREHASGCRRIAAIATMKSKQSWLWHVWHVWQLGKLCTTLVLQFWQDMFWSWHVVVLTSKLQVQYTDEEALYALADNFHPGNSSHGTCSMNQRQQMQQMQFKSNMSNAKIALRDQFRKMICFCLMRWRPSVGRQTQKNADSLACQDFPPTVCKASKNTAFLEKESIREIKSLKASLTLVCNGFPVLKQSLCCQVCIKEKHKEGWPACRTTSRRADRQLRPLIAEKRWSQ